MPRLHMPQTPRGSFRLLALVLAAALAPTGARADEGGLSLLVLSLPKDSASQKAAATGGFVARGAFARNPRYNPLDLEAFLDQTSEIAGRTAISNALAALEKGGHALDELELPTAISSLNEATVGFEQGTAYLEDIQPYLQALLKLGSAYALNNEKDNARDAFKRALLIDRSAAWEKMPDQAKGYFEEAGKKVDETERGALSIFTTPAAAEVYVDGVFQGPAPIVVDRLLKGPHLVRIVRPGYRSAGRPVRISSSSEETIQFPLKPAQKTSELEAITDRIHADVAAGQGATLAELVRFAKVDQAFVMSVISSATDVRVHAVLVDSTGTPIQGGQKSFTGERYRQELDEWIEGGFRTGQAGTEAAVQKDVSTKTTSNYAAPSGGGGSPGRGKIIGGVLLLPIVPLAALITLGLVGGGAFSGYLRLGFPFFLPRDGNVVLEPWVRATNAAAQIVTLLLAVALPVVALMVAGLGVGALAGGIALIAWGNSQSESMDAILAGGGGDAPAPSSNRDEGGQ